MIFHLFQVTGCAIADHTLGWSGNGSSNGRLENRKFDSRWGCRSMVALIPVDVGDVILEFGVLAEEG